MRHGIELRLPYLDRTVVNQALHLPRESTWDGTTDKKILRTLAQNLGVPVAIAQRPRRAPQHGSGILTALERSAHAQQTSLAALLQSMLGRRGKRVAALLSGGKDSVYALHVMDALRYDVVCAITIESQNPDSYMYHTPNISLAQMQAQALHLPHITAQTKGIPEEELDALRSALQSAQKQYHIDGVCTGAIQSQYQRERIERVAEELGLTVWSPLWQMDQLAEIRAIVQLGINAVFVKVAAEGLDSTWLAKNLDAQAIQSLAALHKRIGLHPAGEGGEYETFVTDAPLFAQRIVLSDTEIVKDGLAATLVVRGARLEEK